MQELMVHIHQIFMHERIVTLNLPIEGACLVSGIELRNNVGEAVLRRLRRVSRE